MSLIDNLFMKLSLMGVSIVYHDNKIIVIEDADSFKCYADVNNRIVSMQVNEFKYVFTSRSGKIIIASIDQQDIILDGSLNIIAQFSHEQILQVVKNKILVLVGKNTKAYRLCNIKGKLISFDTFIQIRIFNTSYGVMCYSIKSTGEQSLGMIENDSINFVRNFNATAESATYAGKTCIAIKDSKKTVRIYGIEKYKKCGEDNSYKLVLKLVVEGGNVDLKMGHITPYFTVSDKFKNNVISFEVANILF